MHVLISRLHLVKQKPRRRPFVDIRHVCSYEILLYYVLNTTEKSLNGFRKKKEKFSYLPQVLRKREERLELRRRYNKVLH